MDQLRGMSDQIKEIKGQLNTRDNVGSAFSQTQAGQVRGRGAADQTPSYSEGSLLGSSNGDGEHQQQVKEIVSQARRTVGLHKIDQDDLQRMRQDQFGGAKTEEEEKLLAVQEYLKCELKMDKDDLQNMEIEQIFLPFSDNPKHLYVTFKDESSVARIFERTRIMRKE